MKSGGFHIIRKYELLGGHQVQVFRTKEQTCTLGTSGDQALHQRLLVVVMPSSVADP